MRPVLDPRRPLQVIVLTAAPGKLTSAVLLGVTDVAKATKTLGEDWEETVQSGVYRTGYSYGPDRRLVFLGSTVCVTSDPAALSTHRRIFERAALATQMTAQASAIINVVGLSTGEHTSQVRDLAELSVDALKFLGEQDPERLRAGALTLVGVLLRDVATVALEARWSDDDVRLTARVLPTPDGSLVGKLGVGAAHDADLLGGVPGDAALVISSRTSEVFSSSLQAAFGDESAGAKALLGALGHGALALSSASPGLAQLLVSDSADAKTIDELIASLELEPAPLRIRRGPRVVLASGVPREHAERAAAAAAAPKEGRLSLALAEAPKDASVFLWAEPVGLIRGLQAADDPLLTRDLAAIPRSPGAWLTATVRPTGIELQAKLPTAALEAWRRAMRALAPARVRATGLALAKAAEALETKACACRAPECAKSIAGEARQIVGAAAQAPLDKPEAARIQKAAGRIARCLQRALGR